MRLFLCMSLALGLMAIASALKCRMCDFRALSICFYGKDVKDCTGNCTHTKATLGTVSLFSTEGCSDKCETSQNKSDNVFRFNYTVSCCSTDECNSGNSVKVSLSLGLGIGLLWLLNAV
ncbi:lymphocyte antigen 6 complex locus protein G6c-like [Eleutherodactylus coqui]|uniref:UPAR/Ly6 domain-containing protein n=1 Tax=Eleutherodactylus coqui TaxID=57060 RepID=A0A8J6EKU3_ELECQ|nr:hypothetical protein GDO78_016775 [Eleutherodactylus coqui]KAG9470772.1 hypothetical protein GDO78_016775 [Eleutherodactylus coqui]